ncbi:TlpA family protein disulfide reductase [Streptomyces microflavus]|uniref:TlpA family protein disulfide reductase n=1 Tax=Streptomyces microflavus TaxID=1919 RepID=UPI00369AE2D2
MKRPSRAAILTAAVITALAGCAAPEEPLRTHRSLPEQPLFRSIRPADRPDAPAFSGTSLAGKPLSLAGHRGEVVVVNAWASWCGPCRAEAPALNRIQRKLGDRGVRVMGINNDTELRAARAFEGDYALGYPSLHDPLGKQFFKLPKGLVNTQGLPFTVFVDRAGKLAGAVSGGVSEEDPDAILGALLKEKSGAGQGVEAAG